MLAEHGRMGRAYDQVLSNTVSAFALGDYEWLLALESDQLHDTVDLMRHLRASGARRHVREEVPFFSGRRVEVAGVLGYDAVLLAGFGGPESPEEVMPFLRTVTRGRGVPEERLVEVAHHYQA